MIKGVFIINTTGKGRLVKFYEELPFEKQKEVLNKLYQECSKRGEYSCNFIEDHSIWPDSKIIFRQYATLYIVFVVDEAESELGILDLIQVFVEVMDKAFENVCELDLVFHPDKVYAILEEIIMGGMVVETNINEVWKLADSIFKEERKN